MVEMVEILVLSATLIDKMALSLNDDLLKIGNYSAYPKSVD